MLADTPPWKSIAKLKRNEILYASTPHLSLRENKGLVSDDATKAFRENAIKKSLDSIANHSFSPNVLFVSADPSGGGSSALAFAAMYQTQTGMVVSALYTGMHKCVCSILIPLQS